MKLDTAHCSPSLDALKIPSDGSFALLKSAEALKQGAIQITRLLRIGDFHDDQVREQLQAQEDITKQALHTFTQNQNVEPTFLHAIAAAQSGAQVLHEISKANSSYDPHGRERINRSIDAHKLLNYSAEFGKRVALDAQSPEQQLAGVALMYFSALTQVQQIFKSEGLHRKETRAFALELLAPFTSLMDV